MQILTEAFLQALNMSFTAGIVILCVCLARLALRRAPAVLRYALWAVVLFRLLCPVSFESALALLPTDPAPVGTEILYAPQPEVHTGIAPVDEAVRESLPAAEPAHSANPLQIASAVGAAVWAAGGAGMLLAGVLSLLRLRRRLRGARGNSGVILSLLFRGFSKSLKGKLEANGKDFAEALSAGVEAAYKAVMKPAEGTILTVSRLTGDANRPNGRVERVQRSAKMECNLLGLTVDEALPEVDSFIDRAILNGQTVVYLIHGNGTGALRTAIHKHLRGNRMVKSFRLGRYGEGESGVTVVELK